MTQKLKQRFAAADELLAAKNYSSQVERSMVGARKQAGKRFLQSGIPLHKDEYWKFSSPARFTSKNQPNEINFSRTALADSKPSD